MLCLEWGFLIMLKKHLDLKKKDDVESHNNENINNKDKPAENKGKKEIQHVHSEESVLKDRKIDEQTAIRNFRYLDELIHSGVKEIVLDSDIVLDPDEESQYLNGIKLDADDLAIDGNGHAIDAQGLTRIFYCTGKNIIIKNIILKNGFTIENGGAINNEGELTITESTLTENTTKNGDGGAINNEGELTITESTLTENTAKYGGAIHNNGELTITKSTLTGNTAHRYGGAIHNNKGGELTITKSTLNNNIVEVSGGAIHNNKGGELTITESTLNNNTAHWKGGAIYNNEGELTITESTLNNNTAQRDGGAIHNLDEKSFKIKDCKLDNNIPNNY